MIQKFNRNRGLCALALSLGVFSFAALPVNVWASNSYQLQAIDFINTDDTTEIMLHTGSIVPYRTVVSSNNKLVVDIDRVDATKTVKTNFSGAENVSHVVIQPLSPTRIRLIIRGSHLHEPSIGFKDPRAKQYHYEAWEDTQVAPATPLRQAPASTGASELAGLDKIQGELSKQADEGIQPAVLGEAIGNGFQETQSETSAAHDPSAASLGDGLVPEDMAALDDPNAPLALTGIAEDEQSEGKGNAANAKASASAGLTFAQDWLKSNGGLATQAGALILLLVGFGVFLWRKIQAIKASLGQEGLGDIGENLEQPALRGNGSRFEALANAYRNNSGRDERTPDLRKNRPQSSGNDAPIGLGGLGTLGQNQNRNRNNKFLIAGEGSAPTPRRRQSLVENNSLDAGPAKMGPAAPKRQAINNYKQQAARPSLPPKNRKVNDTALRDEIQRSAEIKRRTASAQPEQPLKQPAQPARQPMPAKATSFQPQQVGHPSQQNVVNAPGNPQVLDFLRSVADLMEKDGNTNVARTIQRNLNQQA